MGLDPDKAKARRETGHAYMDATIEKMLPGFCFEVYDGSIDITGTGRNTFHDYSGVWVLEGEADQARNLKSGLRVPITLPRLKTLLYDSMRDIHALVPQVGTPAYHQMLIYMTLRHGIHADCLKTGARFTLTKKCRDLYPMPGLPMDKGEYVVTRGPEYFHPRAGRRHPDTRAGWTILAQEVGTTRKPFTVLISKLAEHYRIINFKETPMQEGITAPSHPIPVFKMGRGLRFQLDEDHLLASEECGQLCPGTWEVVDPGPDDDGDWECKLLGDKYERASYVNEDDLRRALQDGIVSSIWMEESVIKGTNAQVIYVADTNKTIITKKLQARIDKAVADNKATEPEPDKQPGDLYE